MQYEKDKLEETCRIAAANGMTYKELQVAETKGLVKIVKGKLIKLNKEENNEPNKTNTQRKL